MKVIFEKRGKRVDFAKTRADNQYEIANELTVLSDGLKREARLREARRHYAAAKIQGLARGSFARVRTWELSRQHRAAKAIQRVLRGKFGRRRWFKFFALKTAVVKSDHALKMILERSVTIRAVEKATHHKEQHWQELYDPLTRGIWYFNEHTRINSWKCPFVFQKDLICHWEGFEDIREDDPPVTIPRVKSAKGKSEIARAENRRSKCRCIFTTVIDYQTHLRTAHKWFCSACESKNIGANYPRCFFCGNVRCENTDDGEKLLMDAYNRLQKQLEKFFVKEDAQASQYRYVLKDRLLKIATERKDKAEYARAEKRRLKLAKAKIKGLLIHKGVAHPDEMATDPDVDDTLFPEYETETVSFAARMKERTVRAKEQSEFNAQFLDPVSKMQITAREFEEAIDTTEYSKEHLMHMALMERLMSSDDGDDDDDLTTLPSQTKFGTPRSLSAHAAAHSLLSKADKALGKLLVCQRYLAGKCSLTTCPLAHPGLRDSAKIKSARVLKNRNDSRLTRVPVVTLCLPSRGIAAKCPNGRSCHFYHVYMRPSTWEIIERIYPFQGGPKVKDFPNGLRFDGTQPVGEKGDSLEGYGVFTWTDGSTYMGDFLGGRRDGFGIFRHAGGAEYVGGWLNNARHGKGVYSNLSGEEYAGEWKDGRMDGMGVYSRQILSHLSEENSNDSDNDTDNSLKGKDRRDFYAGEFKNHKFHGLGKYHKANGDVFVGHCEQDQAHGLGIVSLASGEKYKGYFDQNLRHGRGICIYVDGSRYAGHWYRGVREGFGLLLSSTGERYDGHWAADRKQGRGRYLFENGDLYDGDFNRDKANSKGVYFHSNGNVYTGDWVDDRRCGRGVYVYTDGTRYTGYWADNIMHGKGKFDYACGARYRGHVKRGVKHGTGVYQWPNGNEYKGTFEDGLMCGFGEMKYASGHRYVGMWDDNKKNGQGVFYYNLGHVYDGQWVDDLRYGHGKMTFLAGTAAVETYEGDWDDDEKHGYGKYVYNADNGGCYEGTWVRGIRHGSGKHTFKDGSFYRGEFTREKMCGRGVLVRADNASQYDGQWMNNMRHGEGALITGDGTIFHGDFYLNRKHGRGKEIRPDGTIFEGTWQDDIIKGEGRVTLSGVHSEGKNIIVKVVGY